MNEVLEWLLSMAGLVMFYLYLEFTKLALLLTLRTSHATT